MVKMQQSLQITCQFYIFLGKILRCNIMDTLLSCFALPYCDEFSFHWSNIAGLMKAMEINRRECTDLLEPQ